MQKLLCLAWVPVVLLGLSLGACGKKPTSLESVSIQFGAKNKSLGLFQRHVNGDGRTEKGEVDGQTCERLIFKEGRISAYLYLNAVDAFKSRPLPPLTVTVEYFDAAPATFFLEYDTQIEGSGGGAYTASKERIQTKGLQEWQKVTFHLDRPWLAGRQNDYADFRIRVERSHDTPFCVRSVTLTKVK